jgi:tetratricopeptide (TPR) repeat protein
MSARREAQRLMQAKDWPNALRRIEAALAAQAAPQARATIPGSGHDATSIEAARLHVMRAQCLVALGRHTEARDAAAVAEGLAPADASIADAAGGAYSFSGDQVRALRAYERAVDLAPDNPHFLFNRATVRRFLGQLAAAEADYDRVIAAKPDDIEAYKNRSDLRKQTADNNHIAELERLAERGFADWRGEVQIRYALAKEHEDVGNYAISFEHLRRGADKRREHLRYDVSNDVATVEWIIEAFPVVTRPAVAAGPAAAAGPAVAPRLDAGGGPAAGGGPGAAAGPAAAARSSESPIFIVGLPRSGTTLVDRILSSHSDVASAGELNDWAIALVDAVRRASGVAQLPRKDLVARSAHVDFGFLGRDYLRRARAVVSDAPRFTDKMPLNYLYCGLIHRALPAAKIVHVTRHPLASGYAMYKTLFKDGYPFSYDLGDIARYYIAYRRLMAHWHALLPGVIYELPYERLVADQIGETRKLLEYCGLEWQDACVDFHRNAAATTTASASQIREPIYDTSVAQWRHYATQLAPLRDQLHAAGIDL